MTARVGSDTGTRDVHRKTEGPRRKQHREPFPDLGDVAGRVEAPAAMSSTVIGWRHRTLGCCPAGPQRCEGPSSGRSARTPVTVARTHKRRRCVSMPSSPQSASRRQGGAARQRHAPLNRCLAAKNRPLMLLAVVTALPSTWVVVRDCWWIVPMSPWTRHHLRDRLEVPVAPWPAKNSVSVSVLLRVS